MARTENYSDALRRLVRALNETRIRYAVTGAVAVGYHGIPRTSMDIDVVMSGNLSAARLGILASALSRNGFTVSKEEIRRAVIGREVKFQAFDDRTGFLRVDMFLEKSFGRVADRIDGLRSGSGLLTILWPRRYNTATFTGEDVTPAKRRRLPER